MNRNSMKFDTAALILAIVRPLPQWVYGRDWILHKCFNAMIQSLDDEVDKL